MTRLSISTDNETELQLLFAKIIYPDTCLPQYKSAGWQWFRFFFIKLCPGPLSWLARWNILYKLLVHFVRLFVCQDTNSINCSAVKRKKNTSLILNFSRATRHRSELIIVWKLQHLNKAKGNMQSHHCSTVLERQTREISAVTQGHCFTMMDGNVHLISMFDVYTLFPWWPIFKTQLNLPMHDKLAAGI